MFSHFRLKFWMQREADPMLLDVIVTAAASLFVFDKVSIETQANASLSGYTIELLAYDMIVDQKTNPVMISSS